MGKEKSISGEDTVKEKKINAKESNIIPRLSVGARKCG